MGKDYLALQKETAFGTKPTFTQVAGAEFTEFLSETLKGAHQREDVQGAYFETPNDEGLGGYQWGGGFQAMLAADNGIGHLLTNLFGNEVATYPQQQGVTAAWKHRWESPAGAGYTGISTAAIVSRAQNLKQWNYLGGAVSRLSLEAVINQNIRLGSEFMGKQDAIEATPDTVPSPIQTAEFFRHHDSEWKIGATPTLDADVEAWTFMAEAATEIVMPVHSRFGRRVYRPGFNFTGRVDRDFVDALYYERFYGSEASTGPQDKVNPFNVNIVVTGDEIVAPYNYTLTLLLPAVRFVDIDAGVSGRDRITTGVPYRVYRNKTLTYAVAVELINRRVTAY